VDKQVQRQGIATKLLKTVLDAVDSTGLPCVLHATKKGARLYATLGWKVVEYIKAVDENGRIVEEVPVMIREVSK
jgi:GNAT superfamily N-acetyltransferase